MQIRIGITANDLTSRLHRSISFQSKGPVKVTVSGVNTGPPVQFLLPADRLVSVSVKESKLRLNGEAHTESGTMITVQPEQRLSNIVISSLHRPAHRAGLAPHYRGWLELTLVKDAIRVVLITDLESYVRGVLGSEIPASYHQEAIKAQAIAARTYALNPRVSHKTEGFNVCDSYLCCQYFAGTTSDTDSRHNQAITDTKNLIATYQDRPILALFSSCAGGHTESYENAFSDRETNLFPGTPLSYLKGVREGALPADFPQESGLRSLWSNPRPLTSDAWSPHFRWKVTLSDDNLEGHMHQVIGKLRADKDMAPFIVPPPSNQFGHILRFEVGQRGISGIAMSITIHTSGGPWIIRKELVIRSVFANPDLGLPRLKSARIFFGEHHDRLGLLSTLTIFGLGWGHGVGLQQTGAEGMARAGKRCQEILSHYFSGAVVNEY